MDEENKNGAEQESPETLGTEPEVIEPAVEGDELAEVESSEPASELTEPTE